MDARQFENYFKSNEIKPTLDLSHIVCKKCFDSGFIWILYDDNNGIRMSTWAYCNCKQGLIYNKSKPYQLVGISNLETKLYTINEFPRVCFTPSPFDTDFKKVLAEKMKDFSRSIKESEQFWREVK